MRVLPSRLSNPRGAALAVVLTAACGGTPTRLPVTVPLVDDAVPAGFPAGTPSTLAPADNALTEARAQLGKRLFFDTQLSRTREISCSSCHLSDHAFSDPNRFSTGVEQKLGSRNAPALVNRAWGTSFFWDGRAATLEEQAGKPIENPVEMDLPLADAVARVGADPKYAGAFEDAYGEPVTEASLRKAIASFVRVLVSAGSPYDRHLRGDDGDFGEAEQRGEALFMSEKAGCFHCHPGGPLTNEGYFNNGTYTDGGDAGRQVVTGHTGDTGKFKVPGLRNVAASAPYMHDGAFATLDDVLDNYVRGGNGNAFTDPTLQPLTLTAGERADLLAFLGALTDPAFLGDPRWTPPTR
jgi:cytochrome c peroxidase